MLQESLSLVTEIALDNHVSQARGGGRRLPNKGRYGYGASAKPRPGKISQKHLMPGQKSVQKPNDRASFHEL